jgi:hypothetical protein
MLTPASSVAFNHPNLFRTPALHPGSWLGTASRPRLKLGSRPTTLRNLPSILFTLMAADVPELPKFKTSKYSSFYRRHVQVRCMRIAMVHLACFYFSYTCFLRDCIMMYLHSSMAQKKTRHSSCKTCHSRQTALFQESCKTIATRTARWRYASLLWNQALSASKSMSKAASSIGSNQRTTCL